MAKKSKKIKHEEGEDEDKDKESEEGMAPEKLADEVGDKEADDDEKPTDADETDETAPGGKRRRKRKRKSKNSADKVKEEVDGPDSSENVSQHQDSVECTVYVEGIPFDATPEQVKEFFMSNGDIEDVVELRLPTWQDSGRLRGYGHVLFGSTASYEKALTLSGKYLGKRFLKVEPANKPREETHSRQAPNEPPPKDCNTLFVNNLPYNTTEDEVARAFEAAGGKLVSDGVRIARNSVTRQSKGFCYVDFETPADAQKVMKYTKPIIVGGRTLRLDYGSGRIKGSYRSGSGQLWTKEVKQKRSRTSCFP